MSDRQTDRDTLGAQHDASRVARFRTRLESEPDVEPTIRRISQYLGGALRDGTITGADIIVREIDPDSDDIEYRDSLGRFRAPVTDERDVDSACERIAQYLAAVARDPDVSRADVGVREVGRDD